jgi:hypothetical protein
MAALLGAGALGVAIATWLIPAAGGEFAGQQRTGDLSPDIVLPVSAAERGQETGMPPATGGGSLDRAEEGDRRHLTVLTGTLVRCGDEYCVRGVEVDFGPPWYLAATEAPTDYDGDGRVETLTVEIKGLVEIGVTLTVEYGRYGDANAFAIEGVFFRDEIGPPPWAGRSPWAGPPEGAGPPASPPGNGR